MAWKLTVTAITVEAANGSVVADLVGSGRSVHLE